MWPLRKVIHQFLEHLHKENYFTFKDQLYLQKHGTAMGTKMAPSFANIFIGALEKSLLSSAPRHLTPLLWKRFIDDIFLIWTHGEESFQTFIKHLNSVHPTIKFEITYSTKQVNFLDTTVYITPQNTLATTLYTKPTDCMPLLDQSSHHPETCKKSLIYSQMLKYKRIITNDKEFQEKAQNLRVILLGRGYKDRDILPHITKASSYTQSQLLADSPPTNNTRTLPFVIPYNPDLTPLPHILNQHWHYIENDPVLSQVWPKAPVIAYQRHKNLKKHFCSHQVHPITLNQTTQSHLPTNTDPINQHQTTNPPPPPPPPPTHTITHPQTSTHPNTQKPRKQDNRIKSSPHYCPHLTTTDRKPPLFPDPQLVIQTWDINGNNTNKHSRNRHAFTH